MTFKRSGREVPSCSTTHPGGTDRVCGVDTAVLHWVGEIESSQIIQDTKPSFSEEEMILCRATVQRGVVPKWLRRRSMPRKGDHRVSEPKGFHPIWGWDAITCQILLHDYAKLSVNILSHWILQLSHEADTVKIPIVEMKKSRHREIKKKKNWCYTSRKRQNWCQIHRVWVWPQSPR